MTILKTIQTHLKKIEQTEQVHILLAVESGSRAWGFPSPDSDYDVRFIYVRNKEHYLQLQKTSDVIDYMLNDELDINGWDVDKTLRLLRKSNPTLFEWITSPIIYREHAAFSNIRALAQQCFLSKPALHHYFNMASNNNREFLKKRSCSSQKIFLCSPAYSRLQMDSQGTDTPANVISTVDRLSSGSKHKASGRGIAGSKSHDLRARRICTHFRP